MSNKKKLVSIFIPNYNNGKYLNECISSAINQSYENIEIIVSDDCSTDNSVAIINSLFKGKVKLNINKRNLGLVGNNKMARELSSGCYIYLLDADDIMHTDAISRLVCEIEDKNVDIIGSQVQCFGSESSVSKFPIEDKDIKACLYLGNAVTYSGSLYKRKILDDVEKYNVPAHDYLFWIHAASKGYKFRNVDDVFLWYRKHATNETKLNSHELDICEGKHRAVALNLLLNKEIDNKELFLHENMTSVFNDINDLDESIIWLEKLFNLVGNGDVQRVRDYYIKFSLRVWRKNSVRGIKVFNVARKSVFFKEVSVVDKIALFVYCSLKINNKNNIPLPIRKLFYIFKKL
ncbi:glycosyltransferase family 2 protein [Vibrio splendidus]|uniref:glycosyltransferase family 2 protein n=1 Tax=Vibrio splendidus TaxID=29497 RepID=UPI000D346A8D|nr:glycosyltransferase [Vibrio splendidus]CAK2711163.1 hypothetical protein VCRA2120E331_140108 [Vibrio crassostreae]PTO75709.1 hypothetical protein CWN93_21975 [Vibrio splendidus]CAK3202239.1 hypothetical protein VCRA2127O345_140031 [Vibrio crassostreae]CAK3234864.1 hypothetical protein VCRA2120E330_150107 [Vibrio crassostreae]CAK3239415.1 hypothetical protein VCRA2122O338_140031 [Vibrio crassostreae]